MTKREERVTEIINNMNADDFMWALDNVKDNFFNDEETKEEVIDFLTENGITLEEFEAIIAD